MMQSLVNTAVHAKKASVSQCCKVFGVSRSGLYAARQRQRSAKQLSVLDVQATAAFEASGQSYGSRRLSAALKAQGLAVGRHKARGLMRRNGLQVKEVEDLELQAGTYDINSASLEQDYDWIISTVVFMFLERNRVSDILHNIQERTRTGGYNLIVAAMDTEDAPCPMNFSFTFGAGELKEYYRDWELVKYNEDFGQLHKRDENGNFLKMRFATMLARKK